MPSKTTHLLGIGLKFAPANIDAHFIDLSKLIKGLEKKLIKWVVPEEGGGGGLFYKRSAIDFATYAKAELISGRATANLEPLSMVTIRMKREWGFPHPEQIGVATGQMANAIRPVKANKGWKVGIPQWQGLHVKTGSFKKVYQTAYMLEHGRKKGISASGRKIPYQPARPWFSLTFKKWVEERAPKLYDMAFMREFNLGLMKKLDEISTPGVSTVKNVPGLSTSGDVQQWTKYEPGRISSTQYQKAGTEVFINRLGKTVELIYDSQCHWAKAEGEKWYSWAEAQKKWKLPGYK